MAELELRRRRALAVEAKIDRPEHLAHIPDGWEDFARMTRIRSGTEMIPFDPYTFQRRVSDLIDNCRGVVIVKPRQHGLTEMVASKFLHKACLFPTYFAAVFSKSQDDTANIARRVRLMAASAGIELASDNLKDITIKGGGRIVFRTSTPDSGRSLESVWDILYDECGFVKGIEQIYGASTPAQSLPEQQGKAHTILLSTPNTKQGLYYETLVENNGDRSLLDICRQMREQQIEPYQEWVDDQGWGKAIIHWRAHPIHGQNDSYLEEVKSKQKITDAQVQREYNLSFDDPVSGEVLFSRFDESRHALYGKSSKALGYVANIPIHLSCDFNRSPATSGFGQVVRGELRVIKELYLLNSDTFELAERIALWIKSNHHTATVYVHGDASGNQRTANSKKTNWAIIWDALNRHNIRAIKCYKAANPNVMDSINSCNAAFESDEIFINGEECPELITDLNTLREKNGGIDKSDGSRSHAADWFRYMVHDIMPYGAKRKPGNNGAPMKGLAV